MSKPWDVLRRPPEKPPMGPGVFRPEGRGLRIELVEADRFSAKVKIGSEEHTSVCIYPDSARCLSEFFADLADQLDGA